MLQSVFLFMVDASCLVLILTLAPQLWVVFVLLLHVHVFLGAEVHHNELSKKDQRVCRMISDGQSNDHVLPLFKYLYK